MNDRDIVNFVKACLLIYLIVVIMLSGNYVASFVLGILTVIIISEMLGGGPEE